MKRVNILKRPRVQGNCGRFHLWQKQLFSKTKYGFCLIFLLRVGTAAIKTFHYEIGHWDAKCAGQVFMEMFWLPKMVTGIYKFMTSCKGCQKAKPIKKYNTTLQIPTSSLFEVYFIFFAGPFSATKHGSSFILIAIEYRSVCAIAEQYQNSTTFPVRHIIETRHSNLWLP